VLGHAVDSLVRYGNLPIAFRGPFWHLGDFGVCVFFVVSGFIMMLTAGDTFAEPGASNRFFLKRVIRVVPLYWIATGLMYVLSSGLRRSDAAVPVYDLAKSLAFIPYRSEPTGMIQPVLGQGWTLNYEMLFYVIFGFALLLRRGPGIALMVAVFGALAAVGLVMDVTGTEAGTLATFYSNPIMLLFLAGIFLGWLFKERPHALRIMHPFWAIGGLVAANFVLAAVSGPEITSPAFALISKASCVLAVAVCVYAVTSVEGLITRLCERFGDVSYSTYLFHTFVLAGMNRFMPAKGLMFGTIFVLMALVASNFIGYLSFRLLERPLNATMRRMLTKRREAITEPG
jgi:exopolysaccharide production protein ExoZ